MPYIPVHTPGHVRRRLQALVEADGRRQADLAEAAMLTGATLSRVLGGQRGDPSVSTVGAILRALGRSWGDLDPPKRKGK